MIRINSSFVTNAPIEFVSHFDLIQTMFDEAKASSKGIQVAYHYAQ